LVQSHQPFFAPSLLQVRSGSASAAAQHQRELSVHSTLIGFLQICDLAMTAILKFYDDAACAGS
jgi:hypothetical protein